MTQPVTTVSPADTGTGSRVPRPRRSREEPAAPLGSLTQRQHRAEGTCESCGGDRLTRLAIQLSDGAHVDFVSCHHCEHRGWEQQGERIDVASVLERSGRR